MSFANAVVGQINKAIQRAAGAGDTRAVNKLTKMADKPDDMVNRVQQIEAKQAEYGDTPTDTYIHRTNSQGDINEGNFRYRSGSTPAAAGKGEGIFTAPTGYADDTAAYGSRELGVVTERADAPKLGQGRHELAAGSPEIPETFIPQKQVQEIFEITPAERKLTELGDNVVGEVNKFTNNFKGGLDDMRHSNAIKDLFKGKDVSDRNVAGFATDVLKVIDGNSAGAFKRVDGEKLYERIDMQGLYDKVGRKVEARMMKAGDKRMTPQRRREVGAVMLEFARGNMGKYIQEDMVATKFGKKLLLTSSPEFKGWAKSGGRTFMKAFDDAPEVRNPSTSRSHGQWKADEAGEIVEYPSGSTKVDFFAGGSKADVSESAFPNIVDSLNILGNHKTGMDKEFYSLWKNLGKQGHFTESAGPSAEFKAKMNMEKLTPDEFDELTEAFDVIRVRNDLEFEGKKYMKVKEEMFTPRLKALEAIAKGTKKDYNQRTAKQSATRRIKDELDKRFESSEDGGAYFQYNVDTRGRGYPIDPSGASLNSGGAIRHGFTGSTKPISYGDEGFKQIVDDLVLFDQTAKLSKIQGTGLDRHAHWIKNQDKYLKQGEEAITNANNPKWSPSWLKNQKDKGPYLRAVIEVARIKKASDMGQPYESNMMIELDAPSSGSQHIGAQYGDEATLWQTSVLSEPAGKNRILNADEIADLKAGVPDDSVARDLYTDVGVKYSKNVEKGFADLAAEDPKKAEAFKFFSDKFLSSGRGIVKPIVMKVPYGAGDKSLYKDLIKQLTGRQRLEMSDAGVDAEELMSFHWKNMQGALKEGLKTQYEFKKFNKVLGKIYKGSTKRKPFKVEGPDGGITDLTRYVTQSEASFEGVLKPERVPDFGSEARRKFTVYNSIPKSDRSKLGVKGNELDVQETAQGLAPNITHSLDAAYLHRLVKAAADEGIELRVVHDAFFTHPNDAKSVKALAGKVFQDMHANYNLRDKMIEGLAKATGEPVEDIIAQVQKAGLSLEREFDIGAQPAEMFTNVIRGG